MLLKILGSKQNKNHFAWELNIADKNINKLVNNNPNLV